MTGARVKPCPETNLGGEKDECRAKYLSQGPGLGSIQSDDSCKACPINVRLDTCTLAIPEALRRNDWSR